MSSRVRRRFGITFAVVLSLLFSQLALAAYVCPGTSAADEAAVMEMAPGEPCQGMAQADKRQPVLCYQHCSGAPQASDAVKLPVLSLPAIVHVLVLPLVIDDAAQAHALRADHAPPQPPPEPIFLSTLRLRV